MGYFWTNNNVSLRVVNREDIDTFQQNFYDTELNICTEHSVILPPVYEDTEKFIDDAVQAVMENEEIIFVVENDKGEKVGYAKMSYIDERLGNCDCGIYIFKKYRNKRYASSAYEMLLKYIFNERRLHKVHCCILDGNKQGERFLQKFHFKLECARTDMFYVHGRYLTEYYFGLLEDEYRELVENKDKNTEYDDDYLKKLPYSPLDELKNKSNNHLPEKEKYEREYFWSYQDITLRSTTVDDYREDAKILYDSRICRFYDNDVKLPFDLETKEFSNHNTGFKGGNDRLEFAVMNKKKEYIGCVNLCGIDNKNGKFSLSILISKEYRGMGYGTKALRLILSYAFFELRLNKLITVVNDENIASATMMRKVGCRVEGVHRESSFYEGKYVDEIFFGVNKEEFTNANKAYNVIPE